MKIVFRILILSLGFFLVARFCHRQTDGFALQKIRSSFIYESTLNDELLDRINLQKILNQPFYYLGSGAQTFAFSSLDDKYVIKFYRHDRRRHYLAPVVCLLPSVWRESLTKTIEKRRLKALKDFTSYELAYERFKEEAGLIFLHLDTSRECSFPLILYDKIGIRHEISLKDHEFILQRKAQPLQATLEKWIAEQSLEKAQEGLSNLLQILVKRCQNGLFDKDPNLQSNFGFIEQYPIQFDVGRFTIDPSRKQKAVYIQDIIRITDPLKQWLEKHSLPLSEHLQHELEQL